KISRISWSFPEHADWTTCLITYCKDNNDFRLKLFSDSTEEANQQGRTQRQLGTSRDNAYQTLACAVFEHDRDPELKQAAVSHPTLLVGPIKRRFNMLRTQYKKINLQLGASGVGIDIEELRADPNRANLLVRLTETFPWWEDLHGWWKNNPRFNDTASTANPGQDFAAAAVSKLSQGKRPVML
ncbi:hypothetical protein SCLCIDRAFT_145094, partial [Scleroderma citrinum Foug A]